MKLVTILAVLAVASGVSAAPTEGTPLSLKKVAAAAVIGMAALAGSVDAAPTGVQVAAAGQNADQLCGNLPCSDTGSRGGFSGRGGSSGRGGRGGRGGFTGFSGVPRRR